MLEPLLMLTVLNCFFMFSSTVTTCALWWQYRRNRHNCSSHGEPAPKLKVKKSKTSENRTLKDDGKRIMGDSVGYIGSKSSLKKRDKSSSRSAKESKRDKKAKSLGMPMEDASKERRDEESKTMEKLTSTEDMTHEAMSPSSETKSTIVMEVSTIQKVVQIFDKDHDHQQVRQPRETLTYRFSPENERKVEFFIQSKSDERTRARE